MLRRLLGISCNVKVKLNLLKTKLGIRSNDGYVPRPVRHMQINYNFLLSISNSDSRVFP